MKNISVIAAIALQVGSKAGAAADFNSFNGHTYGDGTAAGGSTSGDNVRVDYFDRASIKVALDDLIYGRYVDSKTQQRNSGKTFKISRWRHILRDTNDNNQGIDGEGNVIGNTSFVFNNVAYTSTALATAAKTAFDATPAGVTAIADGVEPTVVTITTGGGNLYGSSRDIGDVTSQLPTLNEGASGVNRVGVTRENFEASLVRKGAYISYTDEVQLFSDQDVQMEYRTKLARLAIEMKDDDTQLGMIGAAGVRFYGGTATNVGEMGQGGEVANLTFDMVRKITKRLRTNLAQMNTEMITGSDKFATTPINRAFYAIIGQDVGYDVESMPEFRAIHEYGYSNKLAQGEWGSVQETRFILTNRAMKYEGGGAADTTNTEGYASTGGNFDVFPIIYPTKGSFATVGLQGKGKIVFKAKAPGAITDTDTYGTKGLFSMNYWFASLALQPERLLVAYVTATA